MKTKTKLLLLLLALVLLLSLSACGRGNEAGNNNDTQSTETKEPIYNPLTGLEVEEEISARLLAVSVDNQADSRPQSGVSKADIVYEMPAEGGIPRLLLVFYSNSCDKIGPVRSARPYFVNAAREWDGLFAHCGWSPQAQNLLQSGVVDYVNEIAHSGYFWRASDRSAPHNLYTSTENLYKYLEDYDLATVQPEQVSFLPFTSMGGVVDETTVSGRADLIYISYPWAKDVYAYNAETQLYARYIGESPFVDKENGQQVLASNIIVQWVESRTLDNEGRLEIDMCAGGKALLFSRGTVTEGTWSRSSLDDQTKFVDSAGNEFVLNPGQTWIQVCDGNVDLNYVDSNPASEEDSTEDSAEDNAK